MANDAVIGVSNSSFCLTVDGPAHVVLDPQGYDSSRATTGLVPVAPARLLDTRQAPASTLGNSEIRRIALPADVAVGARAAAVTITAIGRTSTGYVSAQSCAQPAGLSSTVNTRVGVAVANSARVLLDASGGFCVSTLEGADVIVYLARCPATTAHASNRFVRCVWWTPAKPRSPISTVAGADVHSMRVVSCVSRRRAGEACRPMQPWRSTSRVSNRAPTVTSQRGTVRCHNPPRRCRTRVAPKRLHLRPSCRRALRSV